MLMGILSNVLGIFGFGIGVPIGLLIGFFLFIYFQPQNVKEPMIKKLHELDANSMLDILLELPMWVKHPDFYRIDWLNTLISELWPYLDKAICNLMSSTSIAIFAEYTDKFCIKSIDFKRLSLGTLPPTIHGIKVHETNEKELIMEPAIKWAGNSDINLVLKVLSLPITVQPRVDFGLKLLGADVMAIPGLHQFVQEQIGKKIAGLYLWPQTLDIQILDGSVGAIKKPVGILHVKIVRALNLLKMDLLGTSDPYVKLSLSGERLPSKKTSIKMKNLNPEWNEHFKLIVKDPESQVLQLHVYDWEKVGTHDKLGMQVVPLRLLNPYETKEWTLDLVKNTNPNDLHNKKHRGKLVLEMTFNPFKEDSDRFSGPLDNYERKGSGIGRIPEDISLHRGGLLLVIVQGAEDVEGRHHNNPYAMVIFRGEQKKTKLIKKTRDPSWNEEFQFVLEEAPLKEKIHIEVMSKRTGFSFRSKETLGYVDIDLSDVVYNGRINEKYHLINSKNGIIIVDIRWKAL